MNKYKIMITALLTLPALLIAEPKPWEIFIDANVMLTLNTYSNSWTGEEAGSFSWASHLLFQAHKQLHKKFRTENTLKLGFGQSKIQDKDTDKWSDLQVSTDLIDFETLKKFTLDGFVDPYFAGRVQTTFLDASPTNHEVRYANPIIITESFGVSRNFVDKENHKFSTRFGGATYQRVNRKIKTTNDGGLELVTNYTINAKENIITYTSFLNLYQALMSSENANNKWKTIDIDWQNNLSVNITKYIMINFMFQMLYDRDISEDLRTRQLLSLGLTFKYKSKMEEEEKKD